MAASIFTVAAAYMLGMGSFMLYSSKVGKLKGRERLLNLISWTGGEYVLDVGCGRGLMMIGAAKRLKNGKAVGIDLWQAEDQSSNKPDGAIENARLEGVDDRIEVRTCDMRTLSFGDSTFDVIVSHWAVHNLYEKADRKTAIREMVRVLKLGGSIVLADIEHHEEYAAELKECGLQDVRLIENGLNTKIASGMSFGSFRPAAVFARKM